MITVTLHLHRFFLRACLLGIIFHCSMHATNYQAVTIVPVADLFGESLGTLRKNNTAFAYDNVPLCTQQGNYTCPRMHQTIFNEMVTIIEEHGNEVRLQIPNFFYQTTYDTKKNNTYWAEKKNFIPLSILEKRGIKSDSIPPKISYEHHIPDNKQIVTLIAPFFDSTEKRTFSVGTRFVVRSLEKNNYTVVALNKQGTKVVPFSIDKNYAIPSQPHTHEEQINIFIMLLKKWSHLQEGFIPYVWGGFSFTQACQESSFSIKTLTQKPLRTYYHYEQCKENPKTGFDCTGLIGRAAQIAGIPYYFKNSTTIANNLKPLALNEHLEKGDIIWFLGHVMIISDVEKNLVIEARGYDHGWGKIHEAPLHAIFKNVATTTDLVRALHTQKPLERLNKDGTIAQIINNFKLLKLKSVW